MKIKISIIIPVYNMEDSLKKCIESITRQTYDNYEVILVDDGSNDKSYEMCIQYAQKYSNIFVYHQENQGSGPARNMGMEMATGEYYLFIDSDDILVNNALETLVRYVKDSKSDLYVFGYKLIHKSSRMKERKYGEKIVSGNEVRNDYSPYFGQVFKWGIQGAPWNKLFRAEIVKKWEVKYPALRRHQDEVFISRFVTHVNRVHFIEECLYVHYANDAKLMWRKYPKTYLEIVEQLYEYRKEEILPWNPNNKTIEALIYSEYINNIFRASFRLFDIDEPKDYATRKKWYMDNIYSRFEIKKVIFPVDLLGWKKVLQNQMFIFCVKYKMTWLLDQLIKMRLNTFIYS